MCRDYYFLLRPLLILLLISIILALEEGEKCVMDKGKEGICMRLSACRTVRSARSEIRDPWIACSKTKRLYCCLVTVERAERACRKYHKEVVPRLKKQISDGTIAERGEFPHMVALWYENSAGFGESSTHWQCGGSLISSFFVLSAAHCLDRMEPRKIRVGDTDLKSAIDDSTAAEYFVDKIFIHPGYDPKKSIYNDIALIRTTQEIKFGNFVFPACIQTSRDFDEELSIAGWGYLQFNDGGINETSQLLRKATVDSHDSEACGSDYLEYHPTNYYATLPDGIRNSQICAVTPLHRTSNTCQGDSGGPLQYREGDMYYIIGVTSIGATCGGVMPSVYTRVSEYAPWIELVVWILNKDFKLDN